jgi:hypothetical protein
MLLEGAGEGNPLEEAAMSQARPMVSKEADLWILRVEKPNGKVQEYRCTTEGQARQLALLLNGMPQESAQPSA